jgi:hypothetical protein
MTLKSEFAKVCSIYIQMFCIKNETTFDGWIGGDVGEIANIADMFINFSDIRLDIDTNQSSGTLIKWYWENLETDFPINYRSYMKGLRAVNKDHEKKM